MKVHSGQFRVMIALLVVGSAISLMSLSSCGGKKKGEPVNDENLISRTVDNMELLTTENGKTTNLFKAPLVEDHAFAKAAFQEYRRGIEVIGYDSLEQEASHVQADYALHWTERDLWELKGNVVVTGEDGRKLTTQQLMWDIKLKKIYSNVDSKVEEGEDVFIGEGFEAADDFSQWTFRRLKGRVSVDVEPTADSTAVSAEATPGVAADSTSPPAAPATTTTTPTTQPSVSPPTPPAVRSSASVPPVTTEKPLMEPHAVKRELDANETFQSASETAKSAVEKTPQP